MKLNIALGNDAIVAFDSCELSIDRRTGEVRRDAAGLDKYRVHALLKEAGERRSTPITVNVAAKSDPCSRIAPFTPIEFDGLTLGLYVIDGETVQSFNATAVKKKA